MPAIARDIKNLISRKLLRNGDWFREQEELRERFYSRFLTESDVAFDIGANVGNRTVVFSRLSRIVVAVEPQDHCMAVLRRNFGKNPKVKLVAKAVGPQEGRAEMFLCDVNCMSSLSPAWITTVRQSGRFSDLRWERKRTVDVTTLDKLINEFGMPAFIKVDVEGYEYEVMRGLSTPVKALSFEFVPEYLQCCYQCVDHLSTLGTVHFNYSIGESMQFELPSWVGATDIKSNLSQFTYDPAVWGDIYACFENAN